MRMLRGSGSLRAPYTRYIQTVYAYIRMYYSGYIDMYVQYIPIVKRCVLISVVVQACRGLCFGVYEVKFRSRGIQIVRFDWSKRGVYFQ